MLTQKKALTPIATAKSQMCEGCRCIVKYLFRVGGSPRCQACARKAGYKVLRPGDQKPGSYVIGICGQCQNPSQRIIGCWCADCYNDLVYPDGQKQINAPEHEQRILYYQERASQGLPLFEERKRL